jgi:glc operon protein GlcG
MNHVKSEDAVKIRDAAKAHAQGMGKNVSIMVMDPNGVPITMERMEGAMPMTAIIAEGKAAASALTNMDSAQLQGLHERLPGLIPVLESRAGGRFVPVRGAIVLRRDDEVVGIVAVSGATSEEDEEIGRAGAAAVGL